MHTSLHADLAGHAKTRILFLDSHLQEAKAWKENEDYYFDKVSFIRCFKNYAVILAVIHHLCDADSSNFIFSKRILRQWNMLQSDFEQSIDLLTIAFVKEFEGLQKDLQGLILENLMHISTIVENNETYIRYKRQPILQFLEDTVDFSSSVIYLREQVGHTPTNPDARLTTEENLQSPVIEMIPIERQNLSDLDTETIHDFQAVAGEAPAPIKKNRSSLGLKKTLFSSWLHSKPKPAKAALPEPSEETMPPGSLQDPVQHAVPKLEKNGNATGKHGSGCPPRSFSDEDYKQFKAALELGKTAVPFSTNAFIRYLYPTEDSSILSNNNPNLRIAGLLLLHQQSPLKWEQMSLNSRLQLATIICSLTKTDAPLLNEALQYYYELLEPFISNQTKPLLPNQPKPLHNLLPIETLAAHITNQPEHQDPWDAADIVDAFFEAGFGESVAFKRLSSGLSKRYLKLVTGYSRSNIYRALQNRAECLRSKNFINRLE